MGRNITLDPSSQDNFNDINSWIEACSKHPNCLPSSDTSLPLRLLDVGSRSSSKSRLAITDGQLGKYICLSYCWGTSSGLTTTYSSLSSRLNEIPDIQLPTTLRDAVHITRELGFRYLWIDALCILQRRPEVVNDQEAILDWQEQSLKMADIYGNAFLTIIAADASDKSHGCFISRTPDPHICKLLLDENHSSEVLARLYDIKRFSQKAPIETRAWTFQEEVLSQRRLIYGKEVTYECETCTFRERRQSPLAVPELRTMWSPRPLILSQPVKKINTFIHGNNDSELSNWKPVETLETMRDHTIVQWYLTLESHFCGRLLTNKMDILPALSGVARRVQTIIGGAYYAGIWEVNLPQGLLWKPRNILISGKGKWLSRPTVYRAPSWSWAALKGQIYYGIYGRQLKLWEKEKVKCPCQILEVRTELVGPVYDPMGQVSGGCIKICAPVKAAVLVSASVNAFRSEWIDSTGILHKAKLKENENLLMGSEVPDHSDTQAVGAIGHFDTVDARHLNFCCVLLTLKEGLILSCVGAGSEEFVRIGIFKLQRADWFDGCGSECLIIV